MDYSKLPINIERAQALKQKAEARAEALKISQSQEVKKMEEPQKYKEERPEYSVSLGDDRQGSVRVEEDIFILDNKSFSERHSLVSLTNKARQNTLPEWARQIPGLVDRIESIFTAERARGVDPFIKFSNSDGKLTVSDLRAGTSISAPFSHLKNLLKLGQPLPRAFSSVQARQLIDLAA